MLFLSVYGYSQTAGMAALAENGGDAMAWEQHWRTATLTYAALGALVAVGGTLILFGFMKGALVAAAAVATGAVLPWIAQAANYSRFGFESPNAVESILLVGMAAFLCILFLHREKFSS